MDFPELKVHIDMTSVLKRAWVMALIVFFLGLVSGGSGTLLLVHFLYRVPVLGLP